jgi:tetratricopeptide (TPR) repeat protein
VEPTPPALRYGPEVQAEFQTLVRAIRSEKGRGAVARFTAFLKKYPDHGGAHASIAHTYLAAGNLLAAAPHFERAAQVDPQSPRAQMDWGMTLARMDQPGRAVDRLRASVELDPPNQQARYFLVEQLKKLGQFREARSHLDLLVAANPQEPAYLITRGWLTLQDSGVQARTAAAEKDFRSALALDPNRPDVHYGLGVSLQQQSRWSEAQPELQQAASLGGDIPGAWYALAQTERRLAHPDSAAAAMAKFREVHAKQVKGVQSGFFEGQARANPASADAHYLLGAYYEREGELVSARAEYSEALRIAPGHPAARRRLSGLPHPSGSPR